MGFILKGAKSCIMKKLSSRAGLGGDAGGRGGGGGGGEHFLEFLNSDLAKKIFSQENNQQK